MNIDNLIKSLGIIPEGEDEHSWLIKWNNGEWWIENSMDSGSEPLRQWLERELNITDQKKGELPTEEEMKNKLAIELIARFANVYGGRNGKWREPLKKSFIDGGLFMYNWLKSKINHGKK
jgi:hypothetical protein